MKRDAEILEAVRARLDVARATQSYRPGHAYVAPYMLANTKGGYVREVPFPDLSQSQVRASLRRLVDAGELVEYKRHNALAFTDPAEWELKQRLEREKREQEVETLARWDRVAKRIQAAGLLPPGKDYHGKWITPLGTLEHLIDMLDRLAGKSWAPIGEEQ